MKPAARPTSMPWRAMGPEEQVAYWRAHARIHERRAVAYRRELERNGLTAPNTSPQENR